MAEQYTIGTLAKQAAVNVETIRYYQRRGLVGQPDRPLGGIRRYTQAHARRLRFIREAQRLGFSLEETADLLTLEDGRHCREAEQLGSAKLATVRERMAQLRRVEKVLATLVDQCHCNTGKVRCPLIAALESRRALPTRPERKLAVRSAAVRKG
ncbi:MAG: Hg(II)-responsive transcriptional regulator [Steroidobacteraceae bacterium]